jgi:drug/metabolite transporter (DMT)-like permease
MSAGESVAAAGAAPKAPWFDLAAIAICTLAWGTTWYAITLQLGVVDPIVSLSYRFGIAAALLFAWCGLRGERLTLTRAQHGAALGLGLFNFALDYALVYWAEQRVLSAVVAVVFASLSFANLAVFRIVFRDRAPILAWAAAGLGIIGVCVLSWQELAASRMSSAALSGIGLAVAAVLAASIGNVFARRGELAGASVAALTGWAMFYGAAALALFALATGKAWAFEPSWAYALSLAHLAVNGSVVAFLLYYGLARRRGYASASYISALTPFVAMAMSSRFEAKSWGLVALAGVALVLAGQVLLLRTKRS